MAADGTERRPALLVLASTYPRWPGDPEPAFVHELARRLTDEFAVTVVCPHSPGASERETVDGVDVHRFRYAPAHLETLINNGGLIANIKRSRWKLLLLPLFAAGFILATRRHLATRSFAVVHAHWFIPQGLLAVLAMAGRRAGRPALVVTAHGADVFALRGAMFDRCRRSIAARAARITAVSAALRDRLIDAGVDAGKVVVASMGVDFEGRFSPDPETPRATGRLLFVGRLVEKKGLSVLLQALPTVLADFPGVRLDVAGFGPEEGNLRAQCDRLGIAGSVNFLGAVPQSALPDLYRRATVFIAPFIEAASGDQEGLGLVTLEASGCGCPVLISDLPATRDIFVDRVPPGSPPLLAAAIIGQLSASDETRRAFAQAQRDRLISDYDWRVIGATYAQLLHGAMTTR